MKVMTDRHRTLDGTGAKAGRPRDPRIEPTVLAAVRDRLAAHGYDGLSVTAVAAQAGTTRQAIYRRWSSKADLVTAAIADMSLATSRPDTDDPFSDLVDELAAFRQGVMRPNGVGLVGAMLESSIDPELLGLFRDRVVRPRRNRLRHILERAASAGLLRGEADIETAVAASTGTLYAIYLEAGAIAADWPDRTARLVWRSLGGSPPPAA